MGADWSRRVAGFTSVSVPTRARPAMMRRRARSRVSARPRSTSRTSARTRDMRKARHWSGTHASEMPKWAGASTLGRMHPNERVRAALKELGLETEIREFPASTSTAREAADAVGREIGQIVKTLFFLAEGRPTVVLAAGDRQVDTSALAALVGVGRKRLKMGTPGEVREHTGYEVGGVAPVGHVQSSDVVVDDSLRRFECVWAAAGTGNTVFEVGIEELVGAIGGQWASITRDGA